jgi:hypothetical protein
MLNTQSRRDRSFADVIETLFEERGGRQCSADQVQRVLAKIDDRFLRDDALYEAIQSIESLERDEILIDDQFRTFLLSSYDIASADARCLACAKAYLILVKISKKEWRSASDALVECIETSWNAIDVPAVRIAVGFEIAQILAPISAELSALYLERTEEVRAGIGGLTNANADHAYSLCLQLAIRAFTGLVPKRCHSRQDLERLAVLIGYTPSAGHRALLWADLALRCAVQGDDHLCSEIVSERVRPILSSLSDTDVENSTYAANRTVAMGIVDRLELPYRDEAYYGIIRYLFRNESPYEPEEYIPGSGYEAEYSNLVELCDLTKHLDSDALIYEVIERTIDCLTSKTVTVAYNTAQREEVYRRVQDIVKTKLPAPRHIRHEGYKVIARAQLARFRNDPDLDDLVASAERIPNTADRALVMFTTGLAVGKTARNTADRLLTTAQELVGEIPADWDRLERMIGFAYQAKPYNKALSRKMLEAAVRVVPNLAEGRNRSVRNIVDLAHKIDPAFAKELVEKFDDDRVRVRAKREVQLLDLKDRVAGEKSVYEELQAASAAEYRKIGTMLLASLQSDRNIKAQTIRPCIQTVGGHPITEAFAVLSWIIQNTVDKHASSTKAAYYLRPLFEATLAGVELAGCLASRSFDEFKATQEQYESMAERNADSEAFGKEEAIGFLRSWLDDNTGESVAICDAAFTPEDLLIVQMIRAVNPECRIEILTCKPSALPPEGMSWEDVYTSQWRNLSDQPPPPTRITMISSTAASECPIKAAWLISGDVGLEVGRTLSGLGSNDSMTFKSMDVHEVETLRQDVQKLLTGGIEWAGARIRFSSFSI